MEQEDIADLIDGGMADKIDAEFKKLGYVYVTIDLKGYRPGSMNESLPQ